MVQKRCPNGCMSAPVVTVTLDARRLKEKVKMGSPSSVPPLRMTTTRFCFYMLERKWMITWTIIASTKERVTPPSGIALFALTLFLFVVYFPKAPFSKSLCLNVPSAAFFPVPELSQCGMLHCQQWRRSIAGPFSFLFNKPKGFPLCLFDGFLAVWRC